MQAITVRAANLIDLHELSRLWYEKTILQQQFDRRLALMPDAHAHWTAAAADWLVDANCGIYIAERDHQPIGYVIGWVKPAPPGYLPARIGCVTDMVVDAHSDQGGLGRLLYTAVREWFAERDVQNIVAFVPRRGTVEQAFWRAQGGVEWIDLLWIK